MQQLEYVAESIARTLDEKDSIEGECNEAKRELVEAYAVIEEVSIH